MYHLKINDNSYEGETAFDAIEAAINADEELAKAVKKDLYEIPIYDKTGKVTLNYTDEEIQTAFDKAILENGKTYTVFWSKD